MKKFLVIITLLLSLFIASSCTNSEKTIVVGASPAPHALILEQARAYIESKGYKLKIEEFTDYILPNKALNDGSLDANYFQHLPYLLAQNESNNYDLVSVLKVHFEPLGIYKGTGTTLAALKANDKIAVPDDLTNCARALKLLAKEGVITITNDKGLETTIADVDTKGLEIIPLSAETLGVNLSEFSFAVINGNYALDHNLGDIVVACEDTSGEAYQTFPNVIAVKEGNKDSEKIKILIEALTQPNVIEYIKNEFGGFVISCLEEGTENE